MTSGTDHSTNRQWAEDVSPLCDVREYEMSEKAEPTPGPWEQGDEHFDGGGSWVAIDGPDSEDIAWVRCEQGNQSNAHMIAASRDMYEALDQLHGAVLELIDPDQPNPTGDDLVSFVLKADAALIKARGETQ